MREIENIQHGNYFSIAKASNISQDAAPAPALLFVHRGCSNSLRHLVPTVSVPFSSSFSCSVRPSVWVSISQ